MGGTARRTLATFHSREIDTEKAAWRGFAVDMNEAAVLLDDAVGGSETHAAALAALFCGKERFEDAVANFRLHANARVGDGKDRIEAGDNVGIEVAKESSMEPFRFRSAGGHRWPWHRAHSGKGSSAPVRFGLGRA